MKKTFITAVFAMPEPRQDNKFPRPLGEMVRERGFKCAFTLAEVLITLAIIGVVAALTIPTLVAYNQEKGWDTSSTVFQRKLGEALSIMNTQQTLSGLGTTENFVAELGRHLKLIKVCDNNNLQGCFTDKVMWNDTEVDMTKVKTSENFDKADWNTNIVGFQTASGVNALVAYNPSCKSNPYSNQIINLSGSNNQRRGSVSLGTNGCLAVLYDVDGFSKPNTNNKDIREVGGITLSISSKVCIDTGVCITKTLQPGDYESVDCTNSNSDGYKYCGNYKGLSRDYWAGAMKACKGKLANIDDLAKIANYVYNTTDISATGYKYDLTYDSTKAQEIGFPSSASPMFYAYSSVVNQEFSNSNQGVNVRGLRNTGTDWYDYYGHDHNNFYAVCVE